MRSFTLRTVLLALLLLTFVGASWVSAFAQTAPQPCPMAMEMDMKVEAASAAMMKTDAPAMPMPCEDGTPACTKRICCLIGTALPMPPPAVTLVSFGMVQYLPTDAPQGGRSIEPELFPPIHV